MADWKCPEDWSQWLAWLAAGLHGRCRWRLPVLLMGLLFAQGRRTVSSWLRAAGIGDDFQDYYYFISMLGSNTRVLAERLLLIGVIRLPLGERRPADFRCGRTTGKVLFCRNARAVWRTKRRTAC